jgi:DNA repair protein RecN (Recombination protein N)
MVFDEIDHGIGGLVAGRLARSLEQLAARRQVLCITHLPQIAARATTHFRVVKRERSGTTIAAVEIVDGEARVREIARMLGESGSKGVAVEHARTLLERGHS